MKMIILLMACVFISCEKGQDSEASTHGPDSVVYVDISSNSSELSIIEFNGSKYSGSFSKLSGSSNGSYSSNDLGFSSFSGDNYNSDYDPFNNPNQIAFTWDILDNGDGTANVTASCSMKKSWGVNDYANVYLDARRIRLVIENE